MSMGVGWALITLLVGMAAAGLWDLLKREVPDELWILLSLLGVVLTILNATPPWSIVGLALWVVVGAYGIQHFIPWAEFRWARAGRRARLLEGGLAAGVVIAVAVTAAWAGLGARGVPFEVIAALVVVLVAQGLFFLGVLPGGADAKALISMGLVLPIYSSSWLLVSPSTALALSILPFPLNALVNASVLTLAVPVVIGIRNWRADGSDRPRRFTTYLLPVEELPRRFVWVEEPTLSQWDESRDEETTEADVARRQAQAALLRGRGRSQVRVSPQVPMVFFLALGALVTVLLGNLVLDLAVLL